MTDGVYRYTARNLLGSVHGALGWPAPERLFSTLFGGGPGAYPDDYPTAALQKTLGQYFSDVHEQTKNADFPALLGWESIHGVCSKPTGVGSDWIDDVVTATGSFMGPGADLTMEDLLVLMRDWLLADGRLGSAAPMGLVDDEEQAWVDLLGMPLSTTANTVVDLDDKLRSACGSMLQTPHFWLAGIAPSGFGPQPRLRVCTAGPCTYQEICQSYEPAVEALLGGTDVTCGAGSVSLPVTLVAREPLCPPDICGSVPFERIDLDRCLKDPAACPREPPTCDPRCSEIDCCGGPLPPIDRGDYLVAWAHGAKVQTAEGVRILRQGSKEWTSLEPGETLDQGDLLALLPESVLDFRTRDGRKVKSPRRSSDKARHDTPVPRLMMVSGEELLNKRAPRPEGEIRQLDRDAIFAEYRRGPWQWGEGGRPLKLEERRGFVGFEERLDQDPTGESFNYPKPRSKRP
jgi:hypothetical protein